MPYLSLLGTKKGNINLKVNSNLSDFIALVFNLFFSLAVSFSCPTFNYICNKKKVICQLNLKQKGFMDVNQIKSSLIKNQNTSS